MSHVVKNNSNSFTPRESKCRNQIAVSSNNNDNIDHFPKSQARNIQSDPQIHSFLFYVWNHVSCNWDSGGLHH